MDGVGGLYLGIEPSDLRFSDFAKVGAPQLIADNAALYQFVWGPKRLMTGRALIWPLIRSLPQSRMRLASAIMTG